MNQVVSLLLCVTSARGLYDGREGRAIDFDAGPSSRQQFNLNDLTPAENNIVYTKFNIIGLNDLDSLPPVNIKSINNFQPFPRVFNPWHNYYNFAKRPFQDATERNFLEEGRRSEIVTTPHTTARPTTTMTRTTTTTTTVAPVVEEYDYHYYDFSNSVDTPHHTGHSFNQQNQDHPSSPGDYSYSYSDPGNSLDEDYSYTEYTEYQEEETDQGINTLTGCPGSLRDCLSACSPVVRINGAAYKICVNECLERC